MRELTYQAEASDIAIRELVDSLAREHSIERHRRAFAAAQSLLGAAATVSKLLDPIPPRMNKAHRDFTLARGAQLCDLLSVDDIPGIGLVKDRNVRNRFEHFDEWLDRHFHGGSSVVIDRLIGQSGAMFANGEEPPYLRQIDDKAMTIAVLGASAPATDLSEAIANVGERAEEWIRTNPPGRRRRGSR
jgi:hypothetical protein